MWVFTCSELNGTGRREKGKESLKVHHAFLKSDLLDFSLQDNYLVG